MPEPNTPQPRSVVTELPPTRQLSTDDDSDLRTAVERLGRSVALEGTHPRAEVLMPPEDQLQVRLVKLDAVLRLQEASSDEGIASGAFWALSGALLGIGVNIITSDSTSIPKATWVAIGAALFFLAAIALLWLRLALRTREVKRQLGNNLAKG